MVVGTYLAYFDRFVPSAGATFLKRELGLSDADFGLLAGSLFALAYATGALLFGHLAKGRPAAAFLIGGVAVWTGGVVALAYAERAEHFAMAQSLAGIGQAAFIPAAVAMIASSGDPARIGRITSRFGIAASLGRSSAVLSAGLAITAIGAWVLVVPLGLPAPWRLTFLLTALPNTLLLVILFATFGRSQGQHSGQTHAVNRHTPLGLARMRRTQIGLVGAAGAAVVVIQSTAMWAPSLIVRLHAVDPARAAILAGVAALFGAPLGQLLGGRLLDRLTMRGVAPTWVVMIGILLAGAALSALMTIPRLPVALLLLGGASLALGIASVSALAGLQRETPVADRPRINGYFFATITLVGLGAGPALTGLLSDAGADPATALPRALAIVAGTMFGLSILAHLFVQATGHRIDAPEQRGRDDAQPG